MSYQDKGDCGKKRSNCENKRSSHCTCGRPAQWQNKKRKNSDNTNNKLININVIGIDDLLLPGPIVGPIVGPIPPQVNGLNSTSNSTNGTNGTNGTNDTNGNNANTTGSSADQNKLININIISLENLLAAASTAQKNSIQKISPANKNERLTSLVNTIRSNFNCRRGDGDENKLININVVGLDDLVA